MSLMRTLQPAWWFSAHLHCRFEAVVVHGGRQEGGAPDSAPVHSAERTNPDEINIDDDEDSANSCTRASGAGQRSVEKPGTAALNPDEITLDDEEDEVEAPPPPPPPSKKTQFLALDKCLPKRRFLEVGVNPLVCLPGRY